MRIRNKRSENIFKGIYLLILILFVINVVDDNIKGIYHNFLVLDKLLFFVGGVTAFLIWLGYPVFKYDSDGEVLIVESSEPVLLSRFLSKHFFAEFPKYKLRHFKIKRFFFRRTLYLYLDGKKSKIALKTTISYLDNKQIYLLDKSLNKVIRNNKKRTVNERRPIRRRVTS